MRTFSKRTLQAAVLLVSLGVGLTRSAKADIPFSGSGAAGSLSDPGAEPFSFNFDGGAAETDYLNDWGSPGVAAGVTPYNNSQAAYGMDITFSGGGTVDADSITVGNGAGCEGDTGGGTTFCTISPTDIWEAIQVGPDSIDFLAQNASFDLTDGQEYFVNIFFDGATPTSFTGEWLTEYSPTPTTTTPEPTTILCLGSGLVALGGRLLRRRRTN
jgi:hypothetical protein